MEPVQLEKILQDPHFAKQVNEAESDEEMEQLVARLKRQMKREYGFKLLALSHFTRDPGMRYGYICWANQVFASTIRDGSELQYMNRVLADTPISYTVKEGKLTGALDGEISEARTWH